MGIKKFKRAKDSNMGMSKHRKSGHSHSLVHFTGIKGRKRTRRKRKLSGKLSLTRKQRRMKCHSRVNKYSN